MQLTRCFDIGGTKIVAADVNLNGESFEIARAPTPTNSFSNFLALLQEHCPTNTDPIGISIAGVIQPDNGRILCANIPCLSGKHLSCELSHSLNRDVHIVNDANAFALAEATFGTAKQHELVLAVILGTGVGGGIVVNGKLLDGFGGTTGEWGHGPASATRTGAALPQVICQCGQQQCIDVLGSARGLEHLYAQICSEQTDAKQVIDAWKQGDITASTSVDIWLDIVSGSLASIVNFLGPTIVVVGGGLANDSQLIDALDCEVRSRCLANYTSALLQRAVNGPEQGLVGAAVHCRSHCR